MSFLNEFRSEKAVEALHAQIASWRLSIATGARPRFCSMRDE